MNSLKVTQGHGKERYSIATDHFLLVICFRDVFNALYTVYMTACDLKQSFTSDASSKIYRPRIRFLIQV